MKNTLAKVNKLSKADTKKATDAANGFAAAAAKILSSKSKRKDLDNFGNMLTYSKHMRTLADNAVKQKVSPLHLIALGVFVATAEK